MTSLYSYILPLHMSSTTFHCPDNILKTSLIKMFSWVLWNKHNNVNETRLVKKKNDKNWCFIHIFNYQIVFYTGNENHILKIWIKYYLCRNIILIQRGEWDIKHPPPTNPNASSFQTFIILIVIATLVLYYLCPKLTLSSLSVWSSPVYVIVLNIGYISKLQTNIKQQL